jgi:hypothetical protein
MWEARGMIRSLVLVLLCTVVLLAQSRGKRTERPPAPPVVVELFTSEGCSSCPPADNVLAVLERSGVIVLGEHVDYWDSLGWKDRFSSPLFSSRQQDYGNAMRTGNIYTPQVVINGEKEALGSDSRAIQIAISEAARGLRAPVVLRLSSEQTIAIQVGKLPRGSHKADVLLAVTETGLESNVSAGENTGHKLRHAAVVRTLSRLAELDPRTPGEYTAEARLNLKPDWVRANLKLVLLVQDKENRHIVGAGSLALPALKP